MVVVGRFVTGNYFPELFVAGPLVNADAVGLPSIDRPTNVAASPETSE